ncbi:MAG: tail fiber protein [Bacteroidota bacterium]
MFTGNFAPRGWAKCDGQLLPIAQNTALFSIIGTTYGGDGRTTFALPDLRGRVAIHPGRGPGLSTYNLGQKGGYESAVTAPPTRGSVQFSGASGTGKGISTRQPYQTVNYIICLQGVYPSRS